MTSTNVEGEGTSQNTEIATSERVSPRRAWAFDHVGKMVCGMPIREYLAIILNAETVVSYDSIWTVEVTDSIKPFPGYQNETVFFKAYKRSSDNATVYKAFYCGGFSWHAFYSCDRVGETMTFTNFKLDMVNAAMKSHFDPDPVSFKFVTRLDTDWIRSRGQVLGSEFPYPYLYLEVHISKARGRFFASWAKPEDTTIPNRGRPTRLTDQDMRWLSQRGEIDIAHLHKLAAYMDLKDKRRSWSLELIKRQ